MWVFKLEAIVCTIIMGSEVLTVGFPSLGNLLILNPNPNSPATQNKERSHDCCRLLSPASHPHQSGHEAQPTPHPSLGFHIKIHWLLSRGCAKGWPGGRRAVIVPNF